jgi:putative ABC transport system permease protein
VIVVVGLVLGVALGNWLGTMLTGLYAEFFRFPVLRAPHRARLLLVTGLGLTVATAVRHAQRHLATVRLAPAEAMRPPARATTAARCSSAWACAASGRRCA